MQRRRRGIKGHDDGIIKHIRIIKLTNFASKIQYRSKRKSFFFEKAKIFIQEAVEHSQGKE